MILNFTCPSIQHILSIKYFSINYLQFKKFQYYGSVNFQGKLQSRWENSNKGSISDQELVDTYFELLSNQEIQKLYEIYKLDFQQFNYSFSFRGIAYNGASSSSADQ